MKDLTKENPGKVILLFAIPIVIGQIFQLLYNMADTRIVGMYLGDNSLAAIGATATIVDLLSGFVMGAANGFAVISARFFGAGDEKNLRKTFAGILFLGTGMALILTVLSLFGMNPVMHLIAVPEEHFEEGRGYLAIIIAGLIFTAMYHMLAAVLRSIGDTVTPLVFLAVSVVINILLDLLFIGKMGFGVNSAAVATVLAQGISAGICFLYLWKKYPVLHIKKEDFAWNKILIAELLAAGCSMGLTNSLVSIGSVVLQSAINGFGTYIIVAHAAARKLCGLTMMPYVVLGTTMATYTSQNYGAGRMDRVREGLKKSLFYGVIWSVLVIFLIYGCAGWMVKLLTDTDTQEVIDTAKLYLRIDCLLYVLLAPIFILRNSLQGLGDRKTPLISSGIEMVGKFIAAFTLSRLLGYMGIILTEPIMWIFMVVPLILAMKKQLELKG
jgi:putative MATE family efflux protein